MVFKEGGLLSIYVCIYVCVCVCVYVCVYVYMYLCIYYSTDFRNCGVVRVQGWVFVCGLRLLKMAKGGILGTKLCKLK